MSDLTIISTTYSQIESLGKELKISVSSYDKKYKSAVFLLPRTDKIELPIEPELIKDITGRERAAKIYSDFEIGTTDDIQYSLRLPGLIGASAKTIGIAKELNNHKNKLKELIINVSPNRVIRNKAVRDILPVGISLQQIYRNIVVLDELRPLTVSFSWAINASSIVQHPVSFYINKIEKQYNKGRALNEASELYSFYAQLKNMPKNEKLAEKRLIATHPICNVLFTDETRIKKTASMPVMFYEDNLHNRLPLGSYLPVLNSDRIYKNRLTRSDTKLEPVPLCTKPMVFRYSKD